MLQIFLFSIIGTFFLYCLGALINSTTNQSKIAKFEIYTHNIIYGIIILSFISLASNFFFSLNLKVNTYIFIIIIIFVFFKFLIKKNFFGLNVLYLIILTSTICVMLIYKNYIYRPDASLYHLPFVGILNSEKIIVGLVNVHHRFGFTTIMQYLSAVFNNHLFLEKGIILPSAILASVIVINFYLQIFSYLKNKSISNIHFLYLLFVSLFFIINMSSYNKYGNDAPGHFVLFFLISEILKTNLQKNEFNKILLLSTFIFLNKITFFLVFLFPLVLLIKNKYKFDLKSTFSIFFLFLWLLKNLVLSGCFIYPIKSTCLTSPMWSTINNKTLNTKAALIETEAWSKGFPDQKIYDQENFIINFNWLKTWGKKHLFKIMEKMIPFIIILSVILFILDKQKEKIKKKRILKLLLFFSIISLVLLFLKSPSYRFIYSQIVLFFLISYFLLKKKEIINNKKNIFFIKILIIISIFYFSVKQISRFNNNLDAWPIINKNQTYNKISISNNNILISDDCGYVKNICTYYSHLEKKIYFTHFKFFKVIMNK